MSYRDQIKRAILFAIEQGIPKDHIGAILMRPDTHAALNDECLRIRPDYFLGVMIDHTKRPGALAWELILTKPWNDTDGDPRVTINRMDLEEQTYLEIESSPFFGLFG